MPIPSTNILTATTEPPLLDQLKSLLGGATRADIATGYLFISGFAELTDELRRADMRAIRVLVGRTDRPTLDALAAGLQQAAAIEEAVTYTPRASERRDLGAQAVSATAEALARMDQSDRSETAVASMRDLVSSGRLTMRTYPYGMLHAKAYLCWYDGPLHGAAIVGSSNLTLPGFLGNTELNVQLSDNANLTHLGQWFNALWADSVDVTDDILLEFNRSWALAPTTPYEIYLKTLFELYGAQGIPPKAEPQLRGTPELANFQLDAVRRSLAMVDTHGGCFIGDVVGLGKTYIGSEIVRQLQLREPRGRNPLIIAPAGLTTMWRQMNEIFGLGAEIVSMSMLRAPAGTEWDDEADEYVDIDAAETGIDLITAYPNRGVVLVDEAHNFRSPRTQRYQALYHYLWAGEHPTVLLSATPQNLGPFDIYHQLRLFLDDVNHGLSIEPPDLQEFFRSVEKWYQYEVDMHNWRADADAWEASRRQHRSSRVGKVQAPPTPPQPPSDPYAAIEDALNPVFIRRRRKDIKEIYGENAEVGGQPVRFPKPQLENLPYSLTKAYAAAMPFEQLWTTLKAHQGARYMALDYLTEAALASGKYKDLVRAHNRVAVLVRSLLLKRLESSVAAFRATLQTLVRSNRNFREALESGFVPLGKTATAMLSGEHFDADKLLDTLEQEEERRTAQGRQRRGRLVHDVSDFEVEHWMEDLDADHDALETILDRVSHIAPADDDKLQALHVFLARGDVAAGKTLIFSEAAATVEYLFENLNPGGSDPSIAKITGSNRDSLAATIRRFAPKNNLRPGERLNEPEIQVLLATDVVSEGQNLQDCNRVLNYDLHWNPVRLIQRFGRVDRIGTEHQEIFLHNTWPDKTLDSTLRLTGTLKDRVQAFHDFIGLDERLLSGDERLNDGSIGLIYEQEGLPEEERDQLDEVSAFQRGTGLLQQLEENEPELFDRMRRLPDGIRSARLVQLVPPTDGRLIGRLPGEIVQVSLMTPKQAEGIETPMDPARTGETVVFLKIRDTNMIYGVDDELKPRRITPSQLLSAVECAEETPTERLPLRTNERVMAAFEAARGDIRAQLGVSAVPRSHEKSRRYVRKQIRLLRDTLRDDAEELRRLETLESVFVQGHYPTQVGEMLDQIRRDGHEGDTLVRRLESLRNRFRLNPEYGGSARSEKIEVLRIVCSEGLI